jgi:hypothetical protein
MFLCGFFIEIHSLALFDGDCVLRSFANTRAQAVAVCITHELRLAFHQLDGTLRASRYAQAAAVALILVDDHDVSFADVFSPLSASCLKYNNSCLERQGNNGRKM